MQFIVQPPGPGYLHPVSGDEIRERIAALPDEFQEGVEYVQLSRMTGKRRLFPCYGLQWGTAVYLYPIGRQKVSWETKGVGRQKVETKGVRNRLLTVGKGFGILETWEDQNDQLQAVEFIMC